MKFDPNMMFSMKLCADFCIIQHRYLYIQPLLQKINSESSMQAHSTGDESNSSDTAMSDHHDTITPKTEISDYPMLDDHHPYSSNGGLMDQNRPPSFPGGLLGLQGNFYKLSLHILISIK